MKKACRFIWGILAGEILTLFYKDNSFKKKYTLAKWPDKVKVLFKNIVELNKKIFFDIKEYDYEWKFNEFKDFYEKESKILEKKIKELTEQAKTLNKEKIDEITQNLKVKIQNLKEMAEESIDDVMEKYAFQEKIDEMIAKIKEIEKNIEKTVKKTVQKIK